MELETLLFSDQRPAAPPPPPPRDRPASNARLLSKFGRGTVFSGTDIPRRRLDPALAKRCLTAGDAALLYHQIDGDAGPPRAGSLPAGGGAGGQPAPGAALGPDVVRKLMQELRAVSSPETMGPFCGRYDVYPCCDDVGFWRIIMQGRDGTAYAEGTFVLSIRFPADYPASAPAVRFETQVLHPNVNDYGRICSNVLGADWEDNGAPRMPDVLRMVDSLFAAPETKNPVNASLALKFYTDTALFEARTLASRFHHPAPVPCTCRGLFVCLRQIVQPAAAFEQRVRPCAAGGGAAACGGACPGQDARSLA